MAIAFNIPNIGRRVSPEETGTPNYISAIANGLKLGYMPRNLENASQSQELSNLINAAKAKYAPQQEESLLQNRMANTQHLGAQTTGLNLENQRLLPLREKLLNAQIARQSQTIDKPFHGMLSGEAKDAYALEMLRQNLGEDHPTYKRALDAYNLNQNYQKGLIDYRQSLSESAPKRVATPLGKLEIERHEVEQGFAPGTNGTVRLNNDEQKTLLDKYNLQEQKIISDYQTRQKVLASSNIDKTIESIDPKSLVQYAGLPGTVKKGIEEGKASFGNESKEYKEYTNNLSKVKLLAHQVRQFYGDSIQPQMTQAIELMVNPATWKNNPNIALANYNAVIDILRKETQTYGESLRSTKEFQHNNMDASAGGANSRQFSHGSHSSANSDPLGIR